MSVAAAAQRLTLHHSSGMQRASWANLLEEEQEGPTQEVPYPWARVADRENGRRTKQGYLIRNPNHMFVQEDPWHARRQSPPQNQGLDWSCHECGEWHHNFRLASCRSCGTRRLRFRGQPDMGPPVRPPLQRKTLQRDLTLKRGTGQDRIPIPKVPAQLRELETKILERNKPKMHDTQTDDEMMIEEEPVTDQPDSIDNLQDLLNKLEAAGAKAPAEALRSQIDEKKRKEREMADSSKVANKAKRLLDAADALVKRTRMAHHARQARADELREALRAEEEAVEEAATELAKAEEMLQEAVQTFNDARVPNAGMNAKPPAAAGEPPPQEAQIKLLQGWGQVLQGALEQSSAAQGAIREQYNLNCNAAASEGKNPPDLLAFVQDASYKRVMMTLQSVIPALLQAATNNFSGELAAQYPFKLGLQNETSAVAVVAPATPQAALAEDTPLGGSQADLAPPENGPAASRDLRARPSDEEERARDRDGSRSPRRARDD